VNARALLVKYGLAAKKSWGQNFLISDRVFEAIVEACALDDRTWAIEIGAGLGTLTTRLAERAERVVAIERDRDLVKVLQSELGANARVEIAEANALTFDYAAIAARAGAPPVVVGNLPYQIASQILFRLLEARRELRRIVVMLQREMAERIVAKPATKAYGALGVMVAMSGSAKIVCRAPAGAFVPAPRVESSVVRIEPFAGGATRAPVRDEARFSQVVHAAFNQRRKTLRNALRAIADDAQLDAALAATKLDGKRRGETLTVEEFAQLADALHA
jgi:16S rRNA (adenine1518-N6/adenine1519-N6)-dimethyltransferase